MAVGSILGIIDSAGEYGQGVRQKREGAGTYDPRTGKFYNPQKVEMGMRQGAFMNPLQGIRDPYLTTGEKVASFFGFGAAFADKRMERMQAERAKLGALYTGIENKIDNLKTYEIASEAQEKLAMLEQSGDAMRGYASEASDIARSRASQDAPGTAITRNQIRQEVAAKLNAAQRSGASLGAIAQIGSQEQGALGELNRRNLEYKSQAQRDISNALMSEAQVEAQAAQMGAAGLQGMVSEGDKVYKSNLDKALTALDFDMNMMSQQQMGQAAQMQARAAQTAGLTSAIGNVASSYLSNRSGNSGSSSSAANTSSYDSALGSTGD